MTAYVSSQICDHRPVVARAHGATWYECEVWSETLPGNPDEQLVELEAEATP